MVDETGSKLSWADIRSRYPSQWVVLTNFDVSGNDYAAGVVVDHGPVRRDLLPACRSISPFALVYTGSIDEGIIGVLSDDLDR